MKSKRRIALYIILSLLLVLIAWGMVEPYTVEIEKEEAKIPNLPEEWEGKKIIAIGDFQVGMWLDNDSNMEDVVDRVIQRSPEAVVLLGDYVYHSVDDPQEEMEKAADYIKPLTEEGIPVYAVLGNHDYNMSDREAEPRIETAERAKSTLEAIGVELLHNRSVSLSKENSNEPLYITGIGAHWPNEDYIARAFLDMEKEDARFVMMHNPETFVDIPAEAAPTAVAGHTHGGQIRIPFTPHWSWKDLLPRGKAHVDGWANEEYGKEENRLYINRGLGLSVIPIRLNNAPEITEFHLTSKEK
jgi:uncharacterized protein